MTERAIVVRGAREHNLRDVDVDIPRDKLVVITGPSGSGKSTLAFDTIYAEGQRRYVESLSAYARQFLGQMQKPDVDSIEGLSPAISIEQRVASRNPRSTVGTVTEIHDYLRLLYARAGTPHCTTCGRVVEAHTIQQIVDRVLTFPEGTKIAVLAPMLRGSSEPLKPALARLRKEGFVRAAVNGKVLDLGEDPEVPTQGPFDVDVHVDRLVVRGDIRGRLTDSLELAMKLADGVVSIAPQDSEPMLFSERLRCAYDGTVLPPIGPRTFSFNSPDGACTKCGGLGRIRFFDPARIVPDATLSIAEGAIEPWGKAGGVYLEHMLSALTKFVKVDPSRAWKSIPKGTREKILHGEPDARDATGRMVAWEGVIPGLERRGRDYERRKREQGGDDEGTFEHLEEEFHRFADEQVCDACGGARLGPAALAVRVGGLPIHALAALPIRKSLTFFENLDLPSHARAVADRIFREVVGRLRLLADLGLDYLSLDRASATLSGGESERIRLATQIGSALVGVLYVLDEPSVGLHPRDNDRLIRTLLSLRDLGNTVLVVEHDEETIRAADHVIDMGPGAGKHGGRVVASGSPAEIAKAPGSVTGPYLTGDKRIAVPKSRRKGNGASLIVRDARMHNLRDVTVRFPLGVLTAVTGVSGSGKSSLVMDTLLSAARATISGAREEVVHATIEGLSSLDKVIAIDQDPIGRTPRSSPATYTEVFGPIRELFASLPDARARGYKAGRFSFNVKGGRCESCEGDGVRRIEMHFLPDLHVMCESCGGLRYNRETLEIRYRGASIADVLRMPIDEALEFLSAIPKVRERLAALQSVGLGYVELGQPATTLSGGEAQRVKLARELARRATGKTLYVLDEPTTGLHFRDVEQLVRVLEELVEHGNTVIVIEHNLEVIKVADHVIDMGPDGGDGGGYLVAAGTPEEVAAVPASHTGRFLKPLLSR